MNDAAPKARAVHVDITTLEVDAIVNAANESLLDGGEVTFCCFSAADLDVYVRILRDETEHSR
jgi:hypothetical protein